MASTRGRQVVIPLTNKSGGSVAAGDVVIMDSSNDTAFTTTTTSRYEGVVGIAQETIANNATGRVLIQGYAALVNVPASVTRGHYIETHTVAKQATGSSTRRSGSLGVFLTGGTTPTAVLGGLPDQTASAGSTAVVGCTATRTTDQTGIADSTTTLVVFNGTDEFDSDAFHDPAGANPGRLIVPTGKDGYYIASAFVIWDTNNSGARHLAISKNGSSNLAIGTSDPQVGSNYPYTNVSCPPAYLAATDYVQLNAYQTSGGSRTISGATVPCRFGLVRVGT